MAIQDDLQWWLSVTRIMEDRSEVDQMILRLRLAGLTLAECADAIHAKTGKKYTKGFIDLREKRIYDTIQAASTPPVTK